MNIARVLLVLLFFSCTLFGAETKTQGQSMKKQVFIVHGFGASPKSNWFLWLQKELQKQGVEAKILSLPNPNDPNLQEWKDTIKKEVQFNENSYLVGHSLGCISILQTLQDLKEGSKLAGIVLVSGFNESLPILPQLDSFTKPPLNWNKIINASKHRVVISARDDEIVPTQLSDNLAKNLQATFIQTQNGGHFMDKEGFTKMPLVLGILNYIFKEQ